MNWIMYPKLKISKRNCSKANRGLGGSSLLDYNVHLPSSQKEDMINKYIIIIIISSTGSEGTDDLILFNFNIVNLMYLIQLLLLFYQSQETRKKRGICPCCHRQESLHRCVFLLLVWAGACVFANGVLQRR